jgi:hypothetical protein
MNSDAASSFPRNKAIWLLILIIMLAAGLRLWVISRTILPVADGAGSNMEMAVKLLEGKGWESDRKWTYYGPWGNWGPITHPEGNQQPLTSVLVAGAILVGGVDYKSGQAVLLLLSLASIVLLYLWTARRINRKVALAAAMFAAISPSQIWFSSNLETQSAFQVITLLFLVAAQKWMPDSANGRLKPGHAFLLGLIAGLGYLARTNGLFLLIGLWLWLLFWGGNREKTTASKSGGFARHLASITPAFLLSLLGFCVLAALWWWRNWVVFGSPFYTQNLNFLFADDYFIYWAVRATPPSAAEWFSNHSVVDFFIRMGKGFYAAAEPFILGNLHRNELFAEGPLIVFSLMACIWIARKGSMRKESLPLMVFGIHFISLVIHTHVFRYLLPFYLLVFAYGAAGLQLTWMELKESLRKRIKGWMITALGLLMIAIVILPFGRPLAKVMVFNDRQRAVDLGAAAEYIVSHTNPEQVIVDYPLLENMIWKYKRPTLVMPYASPEITYDVLAVFKPAYLFISPELLAHRKSLLYWVGVDDEGRVVDRHLPGNWHRVWVNPTGDMVIYKLEW